MEKPWDYINTEEVKKKLKAQEAIAAECESVTLETAVDVLTRINKVCDTEMAHPLADGVLCTLLRNLGYNDIVDAYEDIDKLYSY